MNATQLRQLRIEKLKQIYRDNPQVSKPTLGRLFTNYLLEEGLSSETIDSYMSVMRHFIFQEEREHP